MVFCMNICFYHPCSILFIRMNSYKIPLSFIYFKKNILKLVAFSTMVLILLVNPLVFIPIFLSLLLPLLFLLLLLPVLLLPLLPVLLLLVLLLLLVVLLLPLLYLSKTQHFLLPI